jgi:uncharacterized protein (TIRG00374 family)
LNKVPWKIAGLAARLLLVAACLVYLAWGLNLGLMLDAIRQYRWWSLALAQLVLILSLIPSILRFRFLFRGRIGVGLAAKAVLIGWGVNNLLPARLGEAAKAAVLRRHGGVAWSLGAGLIFWERFSDLNALALLAILALGLMGVPVIWAPLLIAVVGLWLTLAALHHFADRIDRWLARLPWDRPREFAVDTLSALRSGLSRRFLAALAGYAALVWVFFPLPNFVVYNLAAGLDLTVGQVLIVFVVSGLGTATPSVPGGIGVYEAAAVWVLSWFGVPKEQALTAAVIQHLIQMLPPTVYTLWYMLRTKARLDLSQGKEKPDSAR